jgi:hypothetical protein
MITCICLCIKFGLSDRGDFDTYKKVCSSKEEKSTEELVNPTSDEVSKRISSQSNTKSASRTDDQGVMAHDNTNSGIKSQEFIIFISGGSNLVEPNGECFYVALPLVGIFFYSFGFTAFRLLTIAPLVRVPGPYTTFYFSLILTSMYLSQYVTAHLRYHHFGGSVFEHFILAAFTLELCVASIMTPIVLRLNTSYVWWEAFLMLVAVGIGSSGVQNMLNDVLDYVLVKKMGRKKSIFMNAMVNAVSCSGTIGGQFTALGLSQMIRSTEKVLAVIYMPLVIFLCFMSVGLYRKWSESLWPKTPVVS